MVCCITFTGNCTSIKLSHMMQYVTVLFSLGPPQEHLESLHISAHGTRKSSPTWPAKIAPPHRLIHGNVHTSICCYTRSATHFRQSLFLLVLILIRYSSWLLRCCTSIILYAVLENWHVVLLICKSKYSQWVAIEHRLLLLAGPRATCGLYVLQILILLFRFVQCPDNLLLCC